MCNQKPVELKLPYPPSVNHYWRRVGQRTLISRGGRRFRASVIAQVAYSRLQPLKGELSVQVDLHPPDRRRRDIDNILKALLDALEHAEVYENDGQISHLVVTRRSVIRGGMALVLISDFKPEE